MKLDSIAARVLTHFTQENYVIIAVGYLVIINAYRQELYTSAAPVA
jgi:hypothetical protein